MRVCENLCDARVARVLWRQLLIFGDLVFIIMITLGNGHSSEEAWAKISIGRHNRLTTPPMIGRRWRRDSTKNRK